MKEQGKLTDQRRIEYQQSLERLRSIAERYGDTRHEGQREMGRIARWVVDQWEESSVVLLEKAAD
jgi:hypothetical protein